MKQITGMVVELKEKTCVILTRSGEFLEVLRPSREVRLGEEIVSAPVKATAGAWWKPLLAAACVFILLWAGFLYYDWSNEAVAYIGLDINPSVELGVNRRQQVCQVSGLDAEGRALLQKVTPRGLPLDEAITAILTEAVSERYLNPVRENVILTTVTTVRDQNRAIPDKQQISRCIEGTLRVSGVKAEVVVEEAPAQVRREAREAGLSTGKYLLRLRGSEKGLPFTIEELKKEKVSDLEAKKHFKTRDLMNPGGAIQKGAQKEKEEQGAGGKEKENGAQQEQFKKEEQKGPDEMKRNGFPGAKGLPNERRGSDREQNDDDDRADKTDQIKTDKINERPDRENGPGAVELPETGQAKPGSAPDLIKRSTVELPKRVQAKGNGKEKACWWESNPGNRRSSSPAEGQGKFVRDFLKT